MSYYNCGIRPKHSNISKRVGEGVIIICVVRIRPKHSKIKKKGVKGYYNLSGIRSKVNYYKMKFIIFLSIHI